MHEANVRRDGRGSPDALETSRWHFERRPTAKLASCTLLARRPRGILSVLPQEHPMPASLTRAFAVVGLVTVASVFAPVALAAKPKGPASTSAAEADADFARQGEYLGTVIHEGQSMQLGVQVIARGDGAFDVAAYPGGCREPAGSRPTRSSAPARQRAAGTMQLSNSRASTGAAPPAAASSAIMPSWSSMRAAAN